MKNYSNLIAIPFIVIASLLTLIGFTNCDIKHVPEYRYAVGDIIPDSNKVKMAEWITKTVSATNLQMTGGDYEDPEDVIEQAEETAERLFTMRVDGLEVRNSNQEYFRFVPKQNLTPSQLKIYEQLKTQ